MSPPLTYLPAYFGLFFSLVLAIACNAFLDIQYGIFGTEVFLWAAVFAFTLRVGWQQRGKVSETGKARQKLVLLLGGIVSVVIFIPMWGFPRAGLYMLAVLQAVNNCVTVTRRQLHFGLLVSIIMVMFAASHYRADWTMLFYLIPYVTSVVFTLVAEQINRHTQDMRQQSVGQLVVSGQGSAIVAATATILVLSGFLYLLTPQPTWSYLEWRYGQLSSFGFIHKSNGGKLGSKALEGADQGSDEPSGLGAGQSTSSQGQGTDGNLGGLFPGGNWPSAKEMRKAAGRPGMPRWQSQSIQKVADMQAMAGIAFAPIKKTLQELSQKLMDWLKSHRQEILSSLIGLIVMAFLVALFLFLREINVIAWLRVHFDYLRFGLLSMRAKGNHGARQYYAAMERYFALHDIQRPATANAREYMILAVRRHDHLQKEIAEMTILFERARYGNTPTNETQINRMRELYINIYRRA